MIKAISEINPYLEEYLNEIHEYILQHHFKNYSGRIFLKNYTTNGQKFRYLSMISPIPIEVKAVDLLLIKTQLKTIAYAIYGEYCIEISLQDAIAQFDKNELLFELESYLPLSHHNCQELLEAYHKPVYSKETIEKMQTLKTYVQEKGMSNLSKIYYEFCEEALTDRNTTIETITQKPIFPFFK